MALSAKETGVVEAVPRQLFIGGRWRDASSGARLGVEDPSSAASGQLEGISAATTPRT